MAAAYSIGIRWVRLEAVWSSVQPNGPGTYDWSVIDQSVEAAEAGGMQVDLIIDRAPTWAQTSSAVGNASAAPASATAYATYAAAVAAHYGPLGVSTYEIGNERTSPPPPHQRRTRS